MSGQPQDRSLVGILTGTSLQSTLNSDQSAAVNNATALTPPPGVTDTQFIQNILDAQATFPNGLYPYAANPNDSQYNSNGFAMYVANRIGIDPQQILDKLSGWPGATNPPPQMRIDPSPTFDGGLGAFYGGFGGGGGEGDRFPDGGGGLGFGGVNIGNGVYWQITGAGGQILNSGRDPG